MSIKVGDRVRLTGKYLRSTGQATGPEGLSRWTVTGIHRSWAITDQPAGTSWYTAEELTADPTLRFRRIALANLETV